uniref:Arrestin domain-containing protein 3-like n=1 Tax=Ciona intestinalis TaxID=7719 RepID=A0A1W2WEH6_CIOIN|nr:arrestin domain-containing protein 3-like [Ciona intestinalis]|eukprot:XP_002129778.1 arrestin domain-containing protein 3-like [Ciona intestinalis]
MGKLQSFYVGFNEGKSVFRPGESVCGSIVINLAAPMKMKAVKIKFVGKANVHWSESRGSGKNRRTVHYRSSETYFEQTSYVYGQGSMGPYQNEKKLPGGQSNFPFQFILPPQLPSSFEGAHGYVRYVVHASIDKPWKFDPNTKTAFTVLDMLDLNQEQHARSPATMNDSKTLCCLCCASGPIAAEVHIDRTGYVPGEFIAVNANVENGSSSKLPGTSASIIQSVTFKTTRKSRTRSNTVVEINGQGMDAGKSLQWNNERLQVPALPPSMLRFCNIIDIQYHLQFTVVTPGTSINLRLNLPIQLGTIPLQGLTPYSIHPPMGSFPVSSPPVEPSAPPPPTYEPPPPTYMAAVGGEVNIRDEDDNEHIVGGTSYAPQYTYYDWSQSAFTYTN